MSHMMRKLVFRVFGPARTQTSLSPKKAGGLKFHVYKKRDSMIFEVKNDDADPLCSKILHLWFRIMWLIL